MIVDSSRVRRVRRFEIFALRALVFAALMGLSSTAAASSSLDAAEKAFDVLEFDTAEGLFQQALKVPGTLDDRLRTYKGLGLAQSFQGQEKKAKASFEKLLLLSPKATVDFSLGPKISKPFSAARKSVGAKRNTLNLKRQDSGALRLQLVEEVPLAAEYTLYVRHRGSASFRPITVLARQPLAVTFSPEQALEAYAEARDAHQGILYTDGSEAQPLEFPALTPAATPPQPAVAAAVKEAQVQARLQGSAEKSAPEPVAPPQVAVAEASGGISWKVVAGIGVAVGAGVAASYFLLQPPSLSLPPADRTARLP